ncbi:hypothetical protein [Variovorax sp. UMC13]|uniref:hypothetical protein n=1 Tax=Variovorax sp. UMC13 TaxID=1862326 RepID=UPI0015FEE819|nr:hypothetical protein [Variovorax sp. UMC13]
MTARPSALLSPEQLSVLRAVARTDLVHGVAISQSLGRAAFTDLAVLRAEGYVREVLSPRKDGSPNHLNALTIKGREALQSHGGQCVSAGASTAAQRESLSRETYAGTEMHPFTGRAGSMDALKYPSRVGDQLRYREDPITLDADPNADPVRTSKRG